jgi:hypothetical protein
MATNHGVVVVVVVVFFFFFFCQLQWPSGKRKAKRSFTVFVKTPNGTEDKTTLKGTSGMACHHGFVR